MSYFRAITARASESAKTSLSPRNTSHSPIAEYDQRLYHAPESLPLTAPSFYETVEGNRASIESGSAPTLAYAAATLDARSGLPFPNNDTSNPRGTTSTIAPQPSLDGTARDTTSTLTPSNAVVSPTFVGASRFTVSEVTSVLSTNDANHDERAFDTARQGRPSGTLSAHLSDTTVPFAAAPGHDPSNSTVLATSFGDNATDARTAKLSDPGAVPFAPSHSYDAPTQEQSVNSSLNAPILGSAIEPNATPSARAALAQALAAVQSWMATPAEPRYIEPPTHAAHTNLLRSTATFVPSQGQAAATPLLPLETHAHAQLPVLEVAPKLSIGRVEIEIVRPHAQPPAPSPRLVATSRTAARTGTPFNSSATAPRTSGLDAKRNFGTRQR